MNNPQLPFEVAFKNPLEERVGKNFFTEQPKKPGVYKMYGRSDKLLYVGKSINLRNRLFTYRRANHKNSSRKTLRLVKMVHRMNYIICESEEVALLREIRLIQQFKPSFNRAKKSPESYYYLSFNQFQNDFKVQLGMQLPEEPGNETKIYGAFKGHGVVRRGTGALLRQLYLLEHDTETPFMLPPILINKFTPLSYTVPVKNGIITEKSFLRLLHQYLNGSSLKFLSHLTERIEKRELLKRFIGKLILKDLRSIEIFFDYCLKRNQQLKQKLGLPGTFIPQEKLDEYMIQAAFIDKKEIE